MKGTLVLGLSVALLTVALPTETSAQASIFVGGTATVPTGDFAGAGALSPFVFGELGFMTHQLEADGPPAIDESESGTAFGVGAGVDVPLGGANGYLGASYTQGMGDIDSTTFISIFAGVGFSVGGGM